MSIENADLLPWPPKKAIFRGKLGSPSIAAGYTAGETLFAGGEGWS
jgi:hypothetical protein